MTHDIPADVVSAENATVRTGASFDNPNPALGTPGQIQDPPADQDTAPVERPLSRREEIAERAKQARREREEAAGDIVQNESGEYIPPFVARQEAEAAAAREADEAAKAEEAKKAQAPENFTLKVRGRDIPVQSRDELIRLAEIEPDEASEFTPAQLIKLAQKQMAANEILDEAKQAKKTARTVARDPDDTLSDPDTTDTDPEGDDDDQQAEHHQPADRRKELIERIQFGDSDEAAAALNDAIAEGVKEVVTGQQFERNFQRATVAIAKAGEQFEAENADIVQNEILSDVLYNRGVVAVLKQDLVSQGLKPENVENVIGNDIRTAMRAYATIAADGRVKVRPPHQLLSAAASLVRQKLNLPAPANTNTPKPAPARTAAPTPANDRLAAKRALSPQPNRASVPLATTAPRNGQAPTARSSVVHTMRKMRGQA